MKRKILIVDDNADTREILSRLLEIERFEVLTAEDGSVGLRVARDQRPDLIVTDISMPVLSGIEMIRLLRTEPEFQRIPIITITAYGVAVQNEARQAGSDRTLPKPVEIDSLLGDIRSLLANSDTEFIAAAG